MSFERCVPSLQRCMRVGPPIALIFCTTAWFVEVDAPPLPLENANAAAAAAAAAAEQSAFKSWFLSWPEHQIRDMSEPMPLLKA